MKRRQFFGSSVLAGAAASGISCAQETPQEQAPALTVPSVTDNNGRLAGKTLEELREECRYWLIDDYLPFLSKHVVDHEHGGFMCTTDRDGTNINTNKRTWYEGRGTWIASHFNNTIQNDAEQVEIARKSVEFIMKQNPMRSELMPSGYTREGKPLKNEPDSIFYGDMFVANGFQEYSEASGDPKYWDMAKQIVIKCLDIYDNREGYGTIPATGDQPEIDRPRMIGHWFMMLRCTTQMLEKRDDAELKAINDRAIDAIMNRHMNPEYELINEFTNHDFSRIESDMGQQVTGHSPETLWMVLAEAVRRKDNALFDRAAKSLKRHIEVLWDDVYGGMMGALTHVNRNEWNTSKSLWLQEEILIGTLIVIEHTGADWAKEWYTRMHTYIMDKFPLKKHGYPLWILYSDRKMTYDEHTTRVGNFHHPRQLMINMKALDRMIERGGKLSGHFE